MTTPSPAALAADQVHRALIAYIEERYAGTSSLILLGAASYLVAGMAAEVIQAQGRELGERELEAVLEGVFDTMRIQIRHHLAGLPTRQ